MNTCLKALFDTVEGHSINAMNEKGLDISPHLKRAWTDLCKAYLVEAKWYHDRYIPILDEYLENAWISISGHIVLTYALCMNEDVTANDLKHLMLGYPYIVRLISMICRLSDDLATSAAEMERGDVAKSIQCYMHEKGVTEFMAREKIKEMIWQYWKLVNSQVIWNSHLEEYFINVALNIPRMAQCVYQHGDGYGAPNEVTKNRVVSVLFEPIEI
ncbi:hypothetical protein LUZ60_008135 [Juncus effusus]|nr:hypothetical protein LUZ60_008135 [Juncus effusus]